MANLPTYPYEKLDYGATLEVAPGVHWVRMPLPFALDHINLWLLEDGDGWTVVDTGYFTDEARDHWRAVLAGLGQGRPVKRAIVTHFHPDHLGLAGWFAEEYGARLWITNAEYLQAHLACAQSITHDVGGWMRFFVDNGLDAAAGERFKEARKDFGGTITPVPVTFRRIVDGEAIEIGGRQWRVITGGGHSAEHAALFCAELNLLISGDQVLPRITTNVSVWYTEPDGDPLRLFLASLERYRPLPPDVFVLPSHDRPFTGLHDRLDALAAHHRDRLDETLAHCEQPRTAMELVPVLFRRALDDHQLAFAMGEALAHLNLLAADGSLRRTRNGGSILYQRVR